MFGVATVAPAKFVQANGVNSHRPIRREFRPQKRESLVAVVVRFVHSPF